MKIRIKGKGLPKAQMWNSQIGMPGTDWTKLQPRIGVPSMQLTPEEEAMRPYDPTYPTSFGPLNTGVGPQVSQKERELQQAYQNDPEGARNYDYGVGQAMLSNYMSPNSTTSRKDLLSYNRFLGKKYKEDTDDGKTEFQNFAEGMQKLGNSMKLGIGVGSMLTDRLAAVKRERDFATYKRNQLSSDALFKPVSGSRGDYVTTGSRFGEYQPDEYVVNRGMFAEQGGEYANSMKIRITSVPVPSMEYGGQSNYGLDLGRRKVYADMPETRSEMFNSTIGAVPREMANIEAEGGETVYGDLDGDGGNEHMKITGPRHSQGGVPLNVPEGSFIFSDTAKMRIKDPEVLKYFGLSAKKGGYTPAEIAKRYDLNKYKAIIEDDSQDELNKTTAQLMMKNYEDKLAKLSMVQESMKGFPQGVPQVAQGEAAYGGHVNLPKAQTGSAGVGQFLNSWMYQPPGEYVYGPGPGIAPQAAQDNSAVVVKNKDPKKPPITVKEQDIFNPAVIEELKKKGYEIKYSPRIEKGDNKVPVKQSKQKSGLYGDVQMSEIAELKARHPWYFADKPNWNPANPKDVLDFQSKYDEEFAKQKGYSYFDGKRSFSNKDSKLGEYTYNAPGLNMRSTPADVKTKFKCTENGVVEVRADGPMASMQVGLFDTYEQALAVCSKRKPAPEKEEPVKPNEVGMTRNQEPPFGYMTPDLVNLASAAMVRPKKYLPYRAPINLPRVSPTFYDPNREIAAQNETANIMAQNAATFANPQAYMANAARLQGNLAEGVANTMGRTQNQNVQVANQFAGINADIIGKENMLAAQRANDLYDAGVIANQQYDNARRAYNRNLAASFATAWNNRMNLGLLNTTNPIYKINPATGQSYFTQGYGPDDLSGSGANMAGMNWSGLYKSFAEAQKAFPGLTQEQFFRMSGIRSTQTDNNADGVADRITTRTGKRGGQVNRLPFKRTR